jgi:nitric oxide reductase subunit C
VTKPTAMKLFFIGTLASAALFIVLTVDTLGRLTARTNEAELTEKVAAGKWAWQSKNCYDCHTMLGSGGYYAPDLSKEGQTRPAEWLRPFLKDPKAAMPEPRQMPNQHLSDEQIGALVAFFQWTAKINTNEWPPQPLNAQAQGPAAPVPGSPAPSPAVQAGKALFSGMGCSACHKINGVGGTVGPDLSHIGSLRTAAWIGVQITDPASHFPKNAMPAFTMLSKEQVRQLVQYLSSLK